MGCKMWHLHMNVADACTSSPGHVHCSIAALLAWHVLHMPLYILLGSIMR